MTDRFARTLDCRRDASRQRDVIALDKHAVIEAETMITRAARNHSVLFQHPQARCGLARVNNLRARAFDGADKCARQRRNSRKALEQIQSDALSREQYVCEATRARDNFSRLDLFTIGCEGFQLLLRVECGEDCLHRFEPWDDHRLFGEKASTLACVAS